MLNGEDAAGKEKKAGAQGSLFDVIYKCIYIYFCLTLFDYLFMYSFFYLFTVFIQTFSFLNRPRLRHFVFLLFFFKPFYFSFSFLDLSYIVFHF